MKIWRKWSFLILLLICGVGILTISDSWQGAMEPAQGIRKWMLAAGANPGIWEAEDWEAEETEETVAAVADGEAFAKQSGNFLPCETEAFFIEENMIPDISPEDERQKSDSPEPEVTYRDPSEVVYTAVEDDYFSDAVFIGDSRTVGMFEYGGLENTAAFYASTGLTVFKLFDASIVPVTDSKEKITVEQALSERQFGKVYLMLGINEMGRGDLEGFLAQYSEVITHLQELQPDAIIYLQGIMKVTTERSNKGDYISNASIEERNAGIAALADNVKVYYLDVNPVICDETGGMEPSYTTDGVHLMAQYIPMWKDFLKQHAVVLD